MGFIARYRVMQRGTLICYLAFLGWTLHWFFGLGNPSGVQGEFAMAILALMGAAVYKIFIWNPGGNNES